MAELIYSAIMSVDGFVEDDKGRFDWAAPDEEVHSFVNELERPVDTYLYGRRMYETMLFWETAHTIPDRSPATRDFTEIWQRAAKVVFSRTLPAASSARTRIERSFDPEGVKRIKETSRSAITIGGAELAARALKNGLVDECRLFVVPVVVGGGKRALPAGQRLLLDLLDERRFKNGTVYMRYRTL